MRNRIIALALSVVMVLLALASCSDGYNYTENISDYTKIADKEGFKNALANIVIEDEYFTGNEDTRWEKVENKIYENLSTYAVNNGEKKESGEIDLNDVLYYAYYTSYTVDGKTYYFDMSKVYTTASPASIKLGSFDVDEKSADALSVAIKNAIDALEDKTVSTYSAITTSGTSVKDSDNKAAYDFIYVSYTVSYNVNEDSSKEEKAAYEKLDLTDTDNELVKLILDANTTAKIGSTVTVTKTTTDSEGAESTEKITEHKITVDGIEYTYKNLKVVSVVEKDAAPFVTFEYAPYTSEQKLTPDSRYTTESSAKVTVPADAKLTYYIYPVYFYEVTNDITAESILKEGFASTSTSSTTTSTISTSSLEIFESEDYKADYTDNSDKENPVTSEKTLKELIEILVEIHSSTSNTAYDDAIEEAEDAVDEKKDAYDAAEKVITDKTAAGEEATEEEIKARDDAKTAYDEAVKALEEAEAQKDADIDNVVASILAATSSEEDAEAVADVIVEQYKESIYEDLEDEYEEAIINKIGKEIWSIIQKYVTVTGYPEKLVETSVENLTDSYEYDFYTGTISDTSSTNNGSSNYSVYGSFKNYLMSAIYDCAEDEIDSKLEAEAQEYLKPILQIYAAADCLKSDASGFKSQVKNTEFLYEDNPEYFEFVLVMADSFMITDDVLDAYKEFAGDIGYDSMIENYGEENLRTALQVQTLFDYLLYAERTKVEGEDHDDHSHDRIEYTYENDKIAFQNISYSIKADADESEAD